MDRFDNRPRRNGFRSNFRNNFGPREPREEHKATCAACGKECTVPFKPKEGRDVFCRECYTKRKQDSN